MWLCQSYSHHHMGNASTFMPIAEGYEVPQQFDDFEVAVIVPCGVLMRGGCVKSQLSEKERLSIRKSEEPIHPIVQLARMFCWKGVREKRGSSGLRAHG